MRTGDYARELCRLSIETGALTFGDFTLKSGRRSPYFFNSGVFSSGDAISRLGHCYAEAILAGDMQFDCLFGPAYKGIPLVVATAVALASRGCDLPYAFNRKEAKTHGEKGSLVGSLKGRVLVIDDVITAGTALREAMEVIRAEGAEVAGLVVAMDRQERGKDGYSAVQEVEREFRVRVNSVASLASLIEYLRTEPGYREQLSAVDAYRQAYAAR